MTLSGPKFSGMTERATSRPSRIMWTKRASGSTRLDPPRLAEIAGRLVAPALLPALLLSVEPVEGAERLVGGHRVDGAEALAQLGLVEPEVAPPPVPDDDVGQLVGRDRPVDAADDHVGDEVGLRGDRHLGMGVEHQPQQRRPRSRRAADERRRRVGRPPVEPRRGLLQPRCRRKRPQRLRAIPTGPRRACGAGPARSRLAALEQRSDPLDRVRPGALAVAQPQLPLAQRSPQAPDRRAARSRSRGQRRPGCGRGIPDRVVSPSVLERPAGR